MLPDSTNQDRVAVEVRTTVDVAYPGTGSTWDCRVGLTPHPVFLGFGRIFDSSGGSPLRTINVLNPTLDGYATYTQAFSAICEKSRLLYGSVTANLICTDLTNEGSCYAVQYDRPYNELIALFGGPSSLMRKTHLYDMNDDLTTDQMTTYKSSYVGAAKDGAYMVLKHPVQNAKWVSSEDTILTGYTNGLTSIMPTLPEAQISAVSHEPYPLQDCMHYSNSTLVLGEASQKPYSTGYGLMVFKGIDKAASVRLTYRMGLELIVRPNTTYAPLLQSPELVDLRAIQIHDEVIAMLNDAYPASYNDLGTFLNVLKKAAAFANKRIFPIVNALVPGGEVMTQAVKTLTGPIGKMIDSKLSKIQTQKKAQKQGSKPSLQPKK